MSPKCDGGLIIESGFNVFSVDIVIWRNLRRKISDKKDEREFWQKLTQYFTAIKVEFEV